MSETEHPVVERFHEILIWPLEFVLPETLRRRTNEPNLVRRLSEYIALYEDNPWYIIDALDRRTTTDKDLQYSEFVYFHPFVQRVLYPTSTEKNPALAILSRSDVQAVEVTLATSQQRLTLDVNRVHLYVFRSQTALLVVEVANRAPLTLSTAQEFADQFRRAYAPYHWKGTGGHCPTEVKWLVRSNSVVAKLEVPDDAASDVYASVWDTAKRRAPIATHWRALLHPLLGAGEAGPEDIGVEQLVDDRIPTMVYMGVVNPFALSRGDFVRICFGESPGDSWDLPYSPTFLADFEKRYVYDRFWNSPHEMSARSEAHFRKPDWRNTRYLCAGYNFAVVTAPSGYGGAILSHFRHHYFQLGLLAHFHRASLLKYSRRLSDAAIHAVEHSRDHWKLLNRVRLEFADFINQYWFREVSNQEQGRELFQWWSERLGNRELLDQLSTEAAAADRILNQERNDKQEEFQTAQQSEIKDLQISTDRLTKAIFWLAGLTLLVAFLDSEMMRTVAQRSGAWIFGRHSDEHLRLWWPLVAWALGVLSIGVWILWQVFTRLFRKKRNADQDRGA